MPPNSVTTIRTAVTPSLSGPTVEWGLGRLDHRLHGGGLRRSEGEGGDGPLIRVVGADAVADDVATRARSGSAEAFDYVVDPDGSLTIVAGGATGAAYGLVGLGDRVSLRGSWETALIGIADAGGSPAVPVRGIMRSFSSVDEDLPWFHDRDFWTEYLDWIAQCRFNRFHLALGMQYNYGADRHGATDNYLCFAYPFLLTSTVGTSRADGVVGRGAADRTCEMLQFIAAETKRRGMSFQLGLWNHAYDYGRDSQHRYEIPGLTPGDPCRLLRGRDGPAAGASAPTSTGFTFRVHYEGGIHDHGHEVFWDKVFDGRLRVRAEPRDRHARQGS